MSERDMQDLLELVERHLGASWTQIIDWLRENNSLDDIEKRLHAHDIAGVIAELDTAAEKYADAILGGYIEAGDQEAAYLGGELDKVVRFDEDNERAVRWAEDNELQIKHGVTEDAKQTVQQLLADGIQRGANPREIARDIRDSIGLTPDRAAAVNSYRRALEQQDYANALSRQLSDGRSDRTIAAAQRDGRALTRDQIDTAVERYRRNHIDSRAFAIAHTDGLRAAHAGSRELFQQAIDDGHVEADQLEREWNHAPSAHPRPGHQAMNGQKRGFDEPFKNPETGAELMYAGDPDADPSETIHCHCATTTTLA